MRGTKGYSFEVWHEGQSFEANLRVPSPAAGIVILPYDGDSPFWSGESIASTFNARNFATVEVDLVGRQEDPASFEDRLEALAARICGVVNLVRDVPELGGLPYGLFSYRPGNCGPASILLAADRPGDFAAIAVLEGRPDRAGRALGQPLPPTLLIIGADDVAIQRHAKDAFRRLNTERKHIELIEGASHGFPEGGKLQEATLVARDWFQDHFLPLRRRAELR